MGLYKAQSRSIIELETTKHILTLLMIDGVKDISTALSMIEDHLRQKHRAKQRKVVANKRPKNTDNLCPECGLALQWREIDDPISGERVVELVCYKKNKGCRYSRIERIM